MLHADLSGYYMTDGESIAHRFVLLTKRCVKCSFRKLSDHPVYNLHNLDSYRQIRTEP